MVTLAEQHRESEGTAGEGLENVPGPSLPLSSAQEGEKGPRMGMAVTSFK